MLLSEYPQIPLMWDESSERRETIGFILRSPYRKELLEFFSGYGSSFPSEIAEKTGTDLPNVSRGLSELQEKGLIELLVPEDQNKHRLYDITPFGLKALNWARTWKDVDDYNIVPRSDFVFQSLLEFTTEALGDDLLGISYHDGNEMCIVFGQPEVQDQIEKNDMMDAVIGDLQSFTQIVSQDFLTFDRMKFLFFEVENPEYLQEDSIWVITLTPENAPVVSIASRSPPNVLITSFAERCLDNINST